MTAMARPAVRGPAIALLYGSALLQGLTLVSFPAAATILKTAGLSDAAFGAIFLPQVAAAVLGALAGGTLSSRIGLFPVLVIALIANAGSQLLLAMATAIAPALLTPCLMIGTALLGLGFGLAGAPFNSLPGRLFPGRGDTALVVAHSSLGAGLALGPLLLQSLMSAGAWRADPLILAGTATLLALLTARARDPMARQAQAMREPVSLTQPALLLPCAIAVLYAFAEGTLSNWIVVYVVQDRGLAQVTASTALSAFWLALVGGRLVASAVVVRIPAVLIWRSLPLGIMVALLLLPHVSGDAQAIMAFGFAGLACSAFFPLSVATVSARFPQAVPFVSSLLTAALMIGVGVGSFIIGGLSGVLGLDRLYLLSVAYPAAILLLMLLDARLTRRKIS